MVLNYFEVIFSQNYKMSCILFRPHNGSPDNGFVGKFVSEIMENVCNQPNHGTSIIPLQKESSKKTRQEEDRLT